MEMIIVFVVIMVLCASIGCYIVDLRLHVPQCFRHVIEFCAGAVLIIIAAFGSYSLVLRACTDLHPPQEVHVSNDMD